jgi:Spirocyclase AveC-like
MANAGPVGHRGDGAGLVIEIAPELRPADTSRWSARIGWAMAAVAFIAFAIVALATMQTGLHGDPRTVNPTPGGSPEPPFLGVTDWVLVTSVASVLLTIGFFGVVVCWSVRDRKPHWALIVGTAALFAGALDPLANWATFTVFNPGVAHFPPSWHYFNASPLLEPTLSFLGGYASYYVLTGVGLLSIHRRVIEPHLRDDGWLGRRRIFSVFITAFIAGLPLNALMQFLWLKVGLFVYTQAAGPVLHIAGTQLPLLMVIYDSVLFAVVAVLCVRDDNDRPAVVAVLAQRLPVTRGRSGSRITAARLLVTATAVLMSAVLVPIAVFSLLRIGGYNAPAYDRYQYPTVKVYDPYGDLQRAGKPGPFYR